MREENKYGITSSAEIVDQTTDLEGSQSVLHINALGAFRSTCQEVVEEIHQSLGVVKNLREQPQIQELVEYVKSLAGGSEVFRAKAEVLREEAKEFAATYQEFRSLDSEDADISDSLDLVRSAAQIRAVRLREYAQVYEKSADDGQLVLSNLEQELPGISNTIQPFVEERTQGFNSARQKRLDDQIAESVTRLQEHKDALQREIEAIKRLGYSVDGEEAFLQIEPGDYSQNEAESARMEASRQELFGIKGNDFALRRSVASAAGDRQDRFGVTEPTNPSAVEKLLYRLAKAQNSVSDHVAAHTVALQPTSRGTTDQKLINGLERRIPVLEHRSEEALQALRANPLGASLVERFVASDGLTPESASAKLRDMHSQLPDGDYHPFQRLFNGLRGYGFKPNKERDIIRMGYDPATGDYLHSDHSDRKYFNRKNTPDAIAALNAKIASADAAAQANDQAPEQVAHAEIVAASADALHAEVVAEAVLNAPEAGDAPDGTQVQGTSPLAHVIPDFTAPAEEGGVEVGEGVLGSAVPVPVFLPEGVATASEATIPNQ